jgi:glycosyltransferase involved in cell wall biosynthesis
LSNPDAYERDGRLARDEMANGSTFAAVAATYSSLVDEVVATRRLDVTGGLNIYGSWGTPSGLVEGARQLGGALLDADVPLTMPWSFKLPNFDVALVPRRFSTVPRTERYAINVITANINEFHVVDRAILGTSHNPRWNIGTWIYEFPEIPEVLAERFDLVDEIWAGSDFAAEVFRPHFDGPMMTLPYVVNPRPRALEPDEARRHFALRESATVVMFSFDFSSGWARKNPLAVVRAFRDATAKGDVDAQLVIKASGLTDEFGAILTKEMDGLDAVLIDAHLPAAEMDELFNTIDVYFSLHRAEGFGLGLAEAMALGKTAIATRYSGNLDFMSDDNSLLVACTPTGVTHEDTEANPGMSRIVRIGARWVEPDREAAAAALTQAFDPAVRGRLGERARADIASRYGAVPVAALVRDRLEQLGDELAARRTDWPSRARR